MRSGFFGYKIQPHYYLHMGTPGGLTGIGQGKRAWTARIIGSRGVCDQRPATRTIYMYPGTPGLSKGG